VRTPDRGSATDDWPTMGAWLTDKLPAIVDVAGMLSGERFVYEDGRAVRAEDPFTFHTFVWFHRDLRDEPHVPGQIHIVHRDERLVVVDKPPFLSSIPRGRHVMQSVVVRLRDELGLPDLSPIHRLDRVTSGVLMLATEQRWRGPYQSLFEHRQVTKTYWALAPLREGLEFPLTVSNHIHKERGTWQAHVKPDAQANARTVIDLESRTHGKGIYRLSPATGKTHQLRVHMWGLGIPILNDPLYPDVLDIEVDDFSKPLQLLAGELAFIDPIEGNERRFTSARRLPITE
jgi:tRNA pseudouridine32 synthase/23S rRNA pseudouridine746 synthase